MSVMPEGTQDPRDSPPIQVSSEPPSRSISWQSRLLRICFAIFTFEIGLFLVVFPWLDKWSLNYFQGVIASIQDIWDDPYFRGAITGLGLVNIYIAMLQVTRLLRRS